MSDAGTREGFQTEGAEVSWRRLGAGQPLLLLNGYAATALDWDPTFLERLAAGSELLCPDHRGIGGSTPRDRELTIELMAADALALLDELGIERAPVLGWSMGGFVAQALAAAAPERISALVLLSTDPGGSATARPEPDTWARLTDHTGTPREQASRLIGLLFPPGVAEPIDAQFGELVAAARSQLSERALSAQEAAMECWHATDPEERLAAIAAPVLAAAGAEDVVIPPANTDALGDRLGGWRALFPGGGHAFMAQEPARLAALIAAFLAR